MKKFLITVFFLMILIAGGLGFFIIRSFNAENFQKQVVQGISELTGRTFTIRGTTSVSWFPIPTIVLNNVVLTNQPDSPRAVMMQAEKVSVQIDWQSMLSLPLEIKQIDIEKPVVYLEKLTNGSRNWAFPFFTKKETNLDGSLISGGTQSPQMKINVMRLNDGTVEFVDAATDVTVMFQNVSGNIGIETVRGPYTFVGKADLNKQNVSFSIKLDKYMLGTPTRFVADLNSTASGFQMNLDGVLTHENTDSDLTANGTFSVQKPAELLKAFQKQLPDSKLAVPMDGSFSVELRRNEDVLKSFILRLGKKEGSPTLTGDLVRNRVNGQISYKGGLAINTLDIALAKRIWDSFKINPFQPTTAPDVDLTLNAQTIQGSKLTATDFNATVQTKAGQVDIPKLHVVLSGNTVVDGSAKSIFVDERAGFEAEVNGQSDNLSALLTVLNVPNLPPEGTLHKATVAGFMRVFPDAVQMDIQSAKIDNTTFSGGFSIEKGEKRPLVVFDLKASNFNADTYLGYQAATEKEDFAQTITAAQNYFKNNKLLTQFDSVFDFEIADLTFRSLPIARLKTSGAMADGVLKLAALEASDMATANMQLSGSLSGIGTDTLAVRDGELTFAADQLPLFLQRANIAPGFHFVQQVSGTAFRVNASFADGTWDLTTQGRIGDLSGLLTGKITPVEKQSIYRDFSLDIAHPNFQQLVQNVLPDARINKSLSGSFKLRGVLNGTARDFQISKGALSIGTQHLNGDVAFKKDTINTLKATITAGSVDGQKMIPDFLKKALVFAPQSEQAFDFSALDNWDIDLSLATEQLLYNTIDLKKTNLKLTVKDKVMTIADLSGQQQNNATSPVKATATLSWAENVTFKTTVELTNVPLKPNFLMIDNRAFGGGAATVKATLSGTGQNPAALIRSLQGDGAFAISGAQFVGADLAQVPTFIQSALQKRLDDVAFKTELNRLLTTGKTTLPPLNGTFTVKDGTVQSVDTKMVGKLFVSDPIQFTWGVPARALDIFMPVSLPHYPDLPPFALTAKGPLNKMEYRDNATDLAAAVNGLVGSALSVERTQQIQAEAVQKQQEQTDRRTRIEQAVKATNEAVQAAENKIYGDTDSPASYLLQNAKDAAQIVNELSVKENPTDAQYIQLMEQSRLAVLRADEAIAEMQKDVYFDDRKQLLAYRKQGQEIVNYLQLLHTERPDIELVGKLVPAAQKTMAELEEVTTAALSDVTPVENDRLAMRAAALFKQLKRAYDYVQRFQLSEPVELVSTIEAVSEPVVAREPSTGIRGKITR